MRARTYRSNNEKNEGPYDVNDYVNHLSRKAFILRRAASITYRMECISSRIHMCNQVVPHTRDYEAIIAVAPFFAACLDKPVVEATTIYYYRVYVRRRAEEEASDLFLGLLPRTPSRVACVATLKALPAAEAILPVLTKKRKPYNDRHVS